MSEIPRIVLGERPVSDHIGQAVVLGGQGKIDSDSNSSGRFKAGGCSKDKRSSDTKSGGTHPNDDDGDDVDDERRDSVGLTIAPGHMPIRSSSDIGLPATSMPNLALSLMSGGPGGDSHLGVYCSPRASRRSVDLEITGPREDGRSDTGEDFRYDWSSQYESLDFGNPGVNAAASNSSNNNTLRVLTSSSRAASALSLTSDCTARSIGLLSNDGDSDSDADASLMSDVGHGQGQHLLASRDQALVVKSGGTAQLRRYMSHPEESSATDVGQARPSVSLINIKSAEASLTDPVDTSRSGKDGKPGVTSDTEGKDLSNSPPKAELEASKEKSPPSKDKTPDPNAHNKTKDLHTDSSKADSGSPKTKPQIDTKSSVSENCPGPGAESSNTIPQSLKDGSLHARTRKADAEERITFSVGGSSALSGTERSGQRILSYKCDPNDNSRNGRIRQWLQDMDKLDLSSG